MAKKYEKRQTEIKQLLEDSKYHKTRYNEGMKDLSQIEKKVHANNSKTINAQFKLAYGYNNPKSLGYKSKKEAVLDSLDYWKRDLESDEEHSKYLKKKADIIANTPINKLTFDERFKIAGGVTKVAAILSFAGAIPLSVALVKTGEKPGESIKASLATAAMVTGLVGSLAHIPVLAASSDERKKMK